MTEPRSRLPIIEPIRPSNVTGDANLYLSILNGAELQPSYEVSLEYQTNFDYIHSLNLPDP